VSEVWNANGFGNFAAASGGYVVNGLENNHRYEDPSSV
jgi:hypothetical protein